MARLRLIALVIAAASLAAACGQGAGNSANGNSLSTISSGGGSSSTTSGSTTATVTIKLSGAPASDVVVGNEYTFTPTATASSGTVTYSITGQPSWTTFDTTNGVLSGIPSASDVGTSGQIAITASDGNSSAAIGPFTITVVAASSAPTSGSASLSWVAPTLNTNGTALTDLAGFHIHYGTTSAALTTTIDVPDTTTTSYVIQNLTQGTYYFSITAYSSLGTESSFSNVVSKTI